MKVNLEVPNTGCGMREVTLNWLEFLHRQGVMLEQLCFHAQQAVEKAFKAVLISLNVPFPRTHSIRTPLDLLSASLTVPEEIEEAAILTDYAVIARYPGDSEPVETDEYQEAIRLAEFALAWAEKVIG